MSSTHLSTEVLIAWAVQSLAGWAEKSTNHISPDLPYQAVGLLQSYGTLLNSQWQADRSPQGRLTPILSLVSPVGEDIKSDTALPARPLAIDQETLLGDGLDSPDLWPGFVNDYRRLTNLPATTHFETFTHLLHRYAWAVPCTYGEPGVSLYEEFKSLAALVHASHFADKPADSFLLVAGDIPGIQEFLYTITSQAAAKGLRGRSFFLQLLSDGLARRILKKLKLPSTNIVYEAGGNFVLLAPYQSAEHLESERQTITQAILTEFQGDLGLALAWERLPADAVGNPQLWGKASRQLKERLNREKGRRFVAIAEAEWEKLFGPQGKGGQRFCAICHRELGADEGRPVEENEQAVACELCNSFRDLAEALGHEKLWLVVEPMDEARLLGDVDWQATLSRLSGYRYRFDHQIVPAVTDGGLIYAINDLDFPAAGAHGFRLLADVTPRVTWGDHKWATEQQKLGNPSYATHIPEVKKIRDFDMLARDGEGIKRIGVLRMDVDNLGLIFGGWKPDRALAGTSALSGALSLFFNGWLGALVKQEAGLGAKTDEERLAAYVIYAGGDDLFIVGAWHLLPKLAERIRDDLRRYTRRNKHLTISAGISLMVRARFPLYQAAEQAHEALDDMAKGKRWVLTTKDSHIVQEPQEKNAICFLDEVVGWDRWPDVRKLQEGLVKLLEEEKTPRALLQIMRTIHVQFEAGRRGYEARHPRQEGEVKNYWSYPVLVDSQALGDTTR